MRVKHEHKGQLGMLVFVFLFMAVTLYMALAGPSALLNLHQAETSEIKTVIVIARHGDEWPSSEAYFLGEPPSLGQAAPAGQLTNAGKERMYLLGKFLKLRYYERLLRGEPQRLHVRSADSDKCLESAQLLAAGLNPPRAQSVWAASDVAHGQLAALWQAKAVHTSEQQADDLLSSRSRCLRNYELRSSDALAWKNSSRYLQLLNEFRHDLQVLRRNTGFEFEDDLEVVLRVERQLRARDAIGHAPAWYTQTMAQRLAHIADVTAGLKFGQTSVQRLYAGRLLDEIARAIFAKVHAQESAAALQLAMTEDEDELERLHSGLVLSSRRAAASAGKARLASQPIAPSVSLLVTDGQHLTALLNALQIYSSQPHFGSLLLVELHYEPANKAHFLRLFLVNSLSHNTFPEPVRVNPVACPLDAPQCSPEQFEQNIRHLSVDKRGWWQKLCKSYLDSTLDELNLEPLSPSTESASTSTSEWTAHNGDRLPVASSSTPQTSEYEPPTSTEAIVDLHEKLDESLIVGPINLRPQTQSTENPITTNAPSTETTNIDAEPGKNPSLETQQPPTTTLRPTGTSTETQQEEESQTSGGPTAVVELKETARESSTQNQYAQPNTILDY